MNDNNFEEIFAWGKERGMKLHTSVSRLCVDGVYGMYATKDIPKFTVIAQYPKKTYSLYWITSNTPKKHLTL